MRGGIVKVLACICAILSLFIGAGVYATWRYVGDNPLDNEPTDVTVAVNEFQWPPEEILPDEEEDSEIGENHWLLVKALVYGLDENDKTIRDDTNRNAGLINENSTLNTMIYNRMTGRAWTTIPERDTLGSMAITQGGPLEEVFNAEEYYNLAFVIQFDYTVKTDWRGNKTYTINSFYIYTLSLDLLDKDPNNPAAWDGSPFDENKTLVKSDYWVRYKALGPVYRTLVERDENDDWAAVGTTKGWAVADYYDENQHDYNIHMSSRASINPDSWQSGDLPSD